MNKTEERVGFPGPEPPLKCASPQRPGTFPGTDLDAGRATANREPRIEAGFTSDHAMATDMCPKLCPPSSRLRWVEVVLRL